MGHEMKIYFDGCSNTWGSELEEPEESRYSRLVSDHFGAEEHNVSKRGSSDKRMIRNLLETDLEPYDYIIVQMTCKNRTEYWCNIKKKWKQLKMDPGSLFKRENKKINGSFDWIDYFKNVYTEKLGHINQLTYYHAMKNVLKDKKHLIIGINGWGHVTKAPVDMQFTNFKCSNSIKYETAPGGHVNKEGHKIIAEEIIKHIEKHK